MKHLITGCLVLDAMRFVMIVAAICSMSLTMHAEDGPARILSVGASSCGTFVKNDAQGKELYLGWAIGFISGMNWRSSGAQRRVGENWDRDAAIVWLENYCSRNPLAAFFTAAETLRDALASKQGITKSK